nr:uncharacterized protein CTRU02_09274 [Colletotrichum truncatum]KAF6788953.1 hypothetical protein CTRU02_09274 [Colletotrichum truncatum]
MPSTGYYLLVRQLVLLLVSHALLFSFSFFFALILAFVAANSLTCQSVKPTSDGRPSIHTCPRHDMVPARGSLDWGDLETKRGLKVATTMYKGADNKEKQHVPDVTCRLAYWTGFRMNFGAIRCVTNKPSQYGVSRRQTSEMEVRWSLLGPCQWLAAQ